MSIFCYRYPRPTLAADCVVFRENDGAIEVLLILRKNEPYADCWAIPGGYMEMDESLEETAKRELKEETNLDCKELTLVGVYSDVNRDPRGRIVSSAYFSFLHNSKSIELSANDDAKDLDWFGIEKLPDLAFDHPKILNDAILLYNLKRSNGDFGF